VGRLPGELARHLARFADVAEREHRAGDDAVAVADRCGGVLDRVLRAVARDEHGMARRLARRRVAQRRVDRVGGKRVAAFADHRQHHRQRLSDRLGERPAGQRFGYRVHVLDAPAEVARHHGVADRGERDLGALLLREQRGAAVVERGQQALDVVCHAVERGDAGAHLGRALDLDAQGMVALAEAHGGVRQADERTQRIVGDGERHAEEQREAEQDHLQQLDRLLP
jgi:hypothetical protein